MPDNPWRFIRSTVPGKDGPGVSGPASVSRLVPTFCNHHQGYHRDHLWRV